MLVTKNFCPGESVYGEKRISVENSGGVNEDGTPKVTKTEYRVWNPFRSKLAAGVLGGLDEIFIKPGAKVLYLGAASGTSVSHVADIVGPTGTVFAVEFSHRSGRDLINMATHRTNVIPIIEDARHPLRYRMLVSMVDVIFADVAQPDQARIVGMNAHLFLKVGGGIVISIKANCIDSTAPAEQVFAREVQKMREERMKPLEQLTLGKRSPAMHCIYDLYSLPRIIFTALIRTPSNPIHNRAFRERSLRRRCPLRPIPHHINVLFHEYPPTSLFPGGNKYAVNAILVKRCPISLWLPKSAVVDFLISHVRIGIGCLVYCSLGGVTKGLWRYMVSSSNRLCCEKFGKMKSFKIQADFFHC